MTTTNEDLGKRIEQMIAEHIAATRRVAQAAVERAFLSSGPVRTKAPRPDRAPVGGKRRAAAELAELGERFLRALSRRPGETMTVLAAEVGASPRELHRAVTRLKQAGRVRAIGQRSHTRYFPLAPNGVA